MAAHAQGATATDEPSSTASLMKKHAKIGRTASKSDPPIPSFRNKDDVGGVGVTGKPHHHTAPTPISQNGLAKHDSNDDLPQDDGLGQKKVSGLIDGITGELESLAVDDQHSKNNHVLSSSATKNGEDVDHRPELSHLGSSSSRTAGPSSSRTSASKIGSSSTSVSNGSNAVRLTGRAESTSRQNDHRPHLNQHQSNVGPHHGGHAQQPSTVRLRSSSQHEQVQQGMIVYPTFQQASNSAQNQMLYQQQVAAAQHQQQMYQSGYHPGYLQSPQHQPQQPLTYVLDASGQYRLASPYYEMTSFAPAASPQFPPTSPYAASFSSQLYSPVSTTSFRGHPLSNDSRRISPDTGDDTTYYASNGSDGRHDDPSPESLNAMAYAQQQQTFVVYPNSPYEQPNHVMQGQALHRYPSQHPPPLQQHQHQHQQFQPAYAQSPDSPIYPHYASLQYVHPQSGQYHQHYAAAAVPAQQYIYHQQPLMNSPSTTSPSFAPVPLRNATQQQQRDSGAPGFVFPPESSRRDRSHHQSQPGQSSAGGQNHQRIQVVPNIYVPPIEMARGQLAQSKLHDAIFARDTKYPDGPGRRGDSMGPGIRGSALPKPPAHSPHALWVGNVPSDASHSELWQFFTTRSPPASSSVYADVETEDGVDLHSPGVESIHLIIKSNCAFVNYASDHQLQHAIAVSNGLPLRPHDPRCKDLVCRVRKKEDDSKSGVGAQRIGGMHHAHIAAREREEKEAAAAAKRQAAKLSRMHNNDEGRSRSGSEPHNNSYSSGHATSISSTSTTSSYLAKHFKERYFILKSHDENDLRLSVERGLWATQSHNEPILQQAFLTSQDVYLIFGANRSGCFFGYARMTSTITNDPEKQVSWSSREQSPAAPSNGGSGSGSNSKDSQDSKDSKASNRSLSRPSAIIEEENEEADAEDETDDSKGSQSSQPGPLAPRIFSPSEQRFLDLSPLPLTPGGQPQSESAPTTLSTAAKEAFEEGAVSLDPSKLRLPKPVKEALDPKSASVPERFHRAVREQQLVGGSAAPAALDKDGIWRKDTIVTPEERNARLEKLEDIDFIKPAPTPPHDSLGWGRPFSVEWIKVNTLPFSRCKHIRNGFNANREVKISRDGTEVEPAAGAALLRLWDEIDDSAESVAEQSSSIDPTRVVVDEVDIKPFQASGMVAGSS